MAKRRRLTRRRWTAPELRVLRLLYSDTPTRKIARALGRSLSTTYQKADKLGLGKSAEYLASPAACRLRRGDNVGARYRFVKGQAAWNKGLHYVAGGRSALTRFKPGSIPANRQEIGALRINAYGGLDIKFKDGLRSWESMARFVWRTERGPIPKGGVIRPINGDAHDTRIANLRLGTRVDLMLENTYHNYPKAIAQLIQLRGALQRQINKREGRRV